MDVRRWAREGFVSQGKLVVGRFYWVQPLPNSSINPEWRSDPQPARYAGTKDDGTLLWNYLGVAGESDWPVIAFFEEISEKD